MNELQDLTALIRANTPLIVIETRDETRVVELFRQALMNVWRALYRWSITEGLRRIDLDREDDSDTAPDISNTLQAIRHADQRGIYLLFDAHPYLVYAGTQRQHRQDQGEGVESHESRRDGGDGHGRGWRPPAQDGFRLRRARRP